MKSQKSEVTEEYTVLENEVVIEFDTDGKKIINGYKTIKTIGKGSFSKVKLVEKIKTGEQYAAKIIDKVALQNKKKGFYRDNSGKVVVNSLLEDSLREIAILKKLFHQNVIKLVEILHDNETLKIYLIMECCSMGPLLKVDDYDNFLINENYIDMSRRKENYSEDEIRRFLRDTIMGLDYLHENGIIHRDIKPDNILLDSSGSCKITDFNVSAMLESKDNDNIGSKIEGTHHFRAPECCGEETKEFAGKPLDIWALGVTAYIMAFKDVPFKPSNSANILELFDLIFHAKIEIPTHREISSSFLDLLLRCLTRDPFERITVKELKEHPWLNEKGVHLRQMKMPEKIHVSNEEVKNCLSFFTKMHIAKKCLEIWKRNSTRKKLEREKTEEGLARSDTLEYAKQKLESVK